MSDRNRQRGDGASPEKPLVLLTGAGGSIGEGFRNAYTDRYRDAYDLRLGAHKPDFSDDRFDDIVTVDIEDPSTLRAACEGVTTVVHLAANPDWEADFCEGLIGPNVIGAYNMFEVARKAGCKRIVYASSVHAIMGFPVDFQTHDHDPARPDTLYGATKVLGEALCSSFAYLHDMSCIALRIGAYTPDSDQKRVVESDNPQLLDIFISERDMAQLIHLCVTAPESVKYDVFGGLSDNRFKRMSIEHARSVLGYAPQDDAFALSERIRFGKEVKV